MATGYFRNSVSKTVSFSEISNSKNSPDVLFKILFIIFCVAILKDTVVLYFNNVSSRYSCRTVVGSYLKNGRVVTELRQIDTFS